MAGLTKEQRAAKAALAPTAEAPQSDDDGLVVVEKDGQTLRAHPTCVESHKAAGWKLKA
jgi:hypothetical protein